MNCKYYNLGLRRRVKKDRFFQHDDFVFEELQINTHGRYWLADPFLFEKNGTAYLFYEAFDLVLQKGYIGYSIINSDGTTTAPKIVIKGKSHYSFPFIFEKNNDVYIMPESCATHSICLFRAVDFPNAWVEDRTIVSDIFGVDTILFEFGQRECLLTSQQYMYPSKDKVISCWVKNRLYDINGLFVIDKDGVIVAEGERGIRNAGAVFDFHGQSIRPGQYSAGGIYGKGLSFFEIESINPYKEKLMYEIMCNEMQMHIKFCNDSNVELVGSHTYNSSEHYEVIDFSYYGSLCAKTVLLKRGYSLLRKAYHGVKKIGALAQKTRNKVEKLLEGEDTYQAVIDKKAPWVFVSYIADAFYHRNDEAYLDQHQNKREVLAMAEVFNKLGYNAYFMLYTSEKSLPDIDCRLVFGHEPGVQRAKAKYKNAKMVFYAVSTYYEYRNQKIHQMTDDFNKRFNAKVPYRRLVNPHTAFIESDATLLIGSETTKNTYPQEYRNKITKIHQSTQKCDYLHNIEASGSKEFFYLASYGNVLKGVQAVVDYFSKHQEYTLHWVGPVEEDVKKAIEKNMTPNIITYGFQDVGAQKALGLMERCDFLIYPSGVEGVPGSVLNAMKNGLIPLVTPWASFDGIEDYGFVMEDASESGVESAVNWAMSLSLGDINRRKKACQKFVLDTFNIDRFSMEFEAFMKKELCGEFK